MKAATKNDYKKLVSDLKKVNRSSILPHEKLMEFNKLLWNFDRLENKHTEKVSKRRDYFANIIPN